jgi:hypothetical protein
LTHIDICWSATVGLSMVDAIYGRDFQSRHLLLALRAGEPYRIARAYALEASHLATAGRAGWQPAKAALERASDLARRIDHPHAIALATLASGMASVQVGQWTRAREQLEKGEVLLRERCRGATWEIDTAHRFTLTCLFYLGEFAELSHRLPILLREAQERGDIYALTSLRTGFHVAAWLAHDDVDAAEHEVTEAMRLWSRSGFHLQHYFELIARCAIDLYTGRPDGALARMREQWRRLKASLLLRVQRVRIEANYVRGNAALAAASASHDPKPLLKEAERTIRDLQREKVGWATALAKALQASLHAVRGETGEAASRFGDAAADFERLDMKPFVIASRRAQGVLLGGKAGEALIAETNEWMAGERVANPDRMAQLLIPMPPRPKEPGRGE